MSIRGLSEVYALYLCCTHSILSSHSFPDPPNLFNMVATKSLIPPFAVALLVLSGLTSAVPTKSQPLPRRTLAVRQATGSAAGVAASTGFPGPYSNSSSSTGSAGVAASSGFPRSKSSSSTDSSSITGTPKIIATETNMAGAINGCTSVSLLVYTDASKTVSTDTICIGSRFPISTDSALASADAARDSSLMPISAPASGCAIGTKHDGSNQGYCTCAGSGTTSASSVSTILGYYRGNLTTACNTGKGSLPTGYVEVPEISLDSLNIGIWATPPDSAVAGNCTTAETLDPRCWEALWMDDYVKWWVSNRGSHSFLIWA